MILQKSTEFFASIRNGIAAFARIGIESVEVVSTTRGSMLVDILVHLPDIAHAHELESALVNRPQDVFSNKFIKEFGIPSARNLDKSKCNSSTNLVLFLLSVFGVQDARR